MPLTTAFSFGCSPGLERWELACCFCGNGRCSCFLPGIAFSVVLYVGLIKSSGMAVWVIALNVLFVSLTLAVPTALLRFWKTLRW